MPIPLYGAMAHGGKIFSLDDPTVVKDMASSSGSGGNTYTPELLSSPFDAGMAYGRLRRLVQQVRHDGTATLTFTPHRDGMETGQTISRSLAVGDSPHVTVPFAVDASEFQVAIAVTAMSAPVELGSGEVALIPRRSQR